MGEDNIRHLLAKRLATGETAYFWNPSKTLRSLGMVPEALGKIATVARSRAVELNNQADGLRRSARQGSNGPAPGSLSRLVADFQLSDEFAELKPRTRKDYAYYLGKTELEFGHLAVGALTALVIKTYYKRVRREVGITWSYHILATLRTVLSWAVSENWIKTNPALDVKMKAPAKRKVIWQPEEAAAYIAQAAAMGWHSIAAMAAVFDSIGQSPVDVRNLCRRAYDGRCIDVARAKTGMEGPPIPLFPASVQALDLYLATQPAKLPDAPLFTHDRIGAVWNESSLQKVHRSIREAAGLPANLQLQDFRTTAATEGGAASGTVDELRALQRHSTRSAGEHYVHPDDRYIESIQQKRLAHRNKTGQKVRTDTD